LGGLTENVTAATSWRFGVLTACILLFGTSLGATLNCSPSLPQCGTVGFSWASTGQPYTISVTSVATAGAAAHAGLRTGDRIDLREVAFPERWRLHAIALGQELPISRLLRYPIHRDGQSSVITIQPQHKATWPTIADWLGCVSVVWILLFAAVLITRRPDMPEARILSLLLLSIAAPDVITDNITPWTALDFAASIFGQAMAAIASITLFVYFATLYGRPLSLQRKYLSAFAIGCAVVFMISSVSRVVAIGTLFPYDPTQRWVANVELVSSALGLLAALACGIAATRASTGVERQRILWVTLSLSVFWIAFALFGFVAPFLSDRVDAALLYAGDVLLITLPLGLTYALLSRRLLDVGFVVSRAAVFGIVSVVVFGTFVLVEYALGAWLSHVSHATSIIVNIAVALVLGFSIRVIHGHVELSVGHLFFRKRHEDLAALGRFAREAAFMSDASALADRTAQIVTAHAGASNVKLLVPDGAGGYAFTNGGAAVSENDPAMLALRTWHEPLDLHRCDTVLDGERAFPMSARGRLAGVLVVGPKQNGEAYAPDECDALEGVATSVGAAFAMFSNADGHAHRVQEQILAELRSLPDRLAEIIGQQRNTR
jgi:hypothetical protein